MVTDKDHTNVVTEILCLTSHCKKIAFKNNNETETQVTAEIDQSFYGVLHYSSEFHDVHDAIMGLSHLQTKHSKQIFHIEYLSIFQGFQSKA